MDNDRKLKSGTVCIKGIYVIRINIMYHKLVFVHGIHILFCIHYTNHMYFL